VLAGVGIASRGRAGWTRLDVGAVLWLALAVPVLLVQHWWLYHFDLFVVPMGWLAARGVEWLLTVPRSPRRTGVIVMVAALLALPMTARVAKSARVVAGHGLGRTVADREAIRFELEPQQRDAAAWAEFVQRRSDPAAGQYALANALLPYRADAPEPVAVHGWSPEQYPPEVWRRLRRELDRSRPAALALDDFSRRILRARSPATLRLIERLWAPAAEIDGVVFMLLRPGAAPEAADQP
jgi:hypothetical protein